MSASHPLLVVTDAGRRRPRENDWLWRHLSFELHEGERLAVRGPTGVGKTLLLRALGGLDPVDEGTIRLNGRSMRQWGPPAFRARVCYLHQRPAFTDDTVEEALARAFRLAVHRDKHFDRKRAVGLFRAVGRGEELLRQPTATLSGGESQLVALVRALLTNPAVLLLDEPTASLDATTALQVERLVRDWTEGETGRAVVWTSHDPAQLQRACTRRLTWEHAP